MDSVEPELILIAPEHAFDYLPACYDSDQLLYTYYVLLYFDILINDFSPFSLESTPFCYLEYLGIHLFAVLLQAFLMDLLSSVYELVLMWA